MSATTSNAIPRNLNLSATKPNAAQAYVRESRCYPVNGTTFSSGGTIRINIDTSTPGAFLDPHISYLQFDFTVDRSETGGTTSTESVSLNNNSTTPSVTYPTWLAAQSQYNESARYYRFPNCGANVFIQEFRIYVQGVPIEEIVDYNLAVSLMHDLQGVPCCKMEHATNMYYANGYPTMKNDGLDAEVTTQEDRIMSNRNVSELRLGNTYRCQLHFMSGVLGSLAEKMFPALLVAPGSMYIELRLAVASNCCVSYVTQKDRTTENTSQSVLAKYPISIGNPLVQTAGTTWASSYDHYAGQSNHEACDLDIPNTKYKGACVNPSTPRVRLTPTEDLKSNTLSYTLTNVQFVYKQIVLTDTVASAIISRAASADISIHTQSFRTYSTEAVNAMGTASEAGTSLQLLIPAKVASANSLFVVFRDRTQANNAQTEYLGRQSIGLQHDGQGASYQLRIGNELIPQNPVNTPNEALMQLLRAMHDYPNINHSSVFGQVKSSKWITDTVQDDYSHPLIQFPAAGWLTCQRQGRPYWLETDVASVGKDFTKGKRWLSNHGHNFEQFYGVTWEPYFYSTFVMGFDLDNFQNNSDVMRSGKYLGNNTVQLLLTNTKVSPVDMKSGNHNPALIHYIVGHDVRLSFQAGGVVQSFY